MLTDSGSLESVSVFPSPRIAPAPFAAWDRIGPGLPFRPRFSLARLRRRGADAVACTRRRVSKLSTQPGSFLPFDWAVGREGAFQLSRSNAGVDPKEIRVCTGGEGKGQLERAGRTGRTSLLTWTGGTGTGPEGGKIETANEKVRNACDWKHPPMEIHDRATRVAVRSPIGWTEWTAMDADRGVRYFIRRCRVVPKAAEGRSVDLPFQSCPGSLGIGHGFPSRDLPHPKRKRPIRLDLSRRGRSSGTRSTHPPDPYPDNRIDNRWHGCGIDNRSHRRASSFQKIGAHSPKEADRSRHSTQRFQGRAGFHRSGKTLGTVFWIERPESGLSRDGSGEG